MGHRVVGGVAVGAGLIIGPAYGMAVGLDPQAIAGSEVGEGASVRPGQQLFGWVNWRGVAMRLCWVPETGRSPLSSELVGGVWIRRGNERWDCHFLLAGILRYGDMRPRR